MKERRKEGKNDGQCLCPTESRGTECGALRGADDIIGVSQRIDHQGRTQAQRTSSFINKDGAGSSSPCYQDNFLSITHNPLRQTPTETSLHFSLEEHFRVKSSVLKVPHRALCDLHDAQ